MSERNFSRRKKSGQRFRPAGGLSSRNKKSEKQAQEARLHAIGVVKDDEPVFDESRHKNEIERAENIAAGLPPDGERKIEKRPPSDVKDGKSP